MHEHNRFLQLLQPSLASALTAIGLSIGLFGGSAFFYFAHNGSVYDFLFGATSSEEVVRHSKNTVSALNNAIFGNPLLNKVLYFAFWMAVGLLVYFLLYMIIKSLSNAAEDIEATTYKNARLDDVLNSLLTRLAVRLLALLVWIMYAFFFVKVVLVYCTLWTRLAMSGFPRMSGWLYSLLALSILTIGFHLHVIFLRLIALKVRLIDNSTID